MSTRAISPAHVEARSHRWILGVVAVALVGCVVGYRLPKAARALAVNATLGVVSVVANRLGAGVELSLAAVVVCGLAGVSGATLVIVGTVGRCVRRRRRPARVSGARGARECRGRRVARETRGRIELRGY
ncbi:hypothetical protein [Halobaculum sp. MBLA0143]|uniref:hypothetical protein n=1 Tax=Halobaculum sp. MBLA0143 TaxID=3079933 RepID=UPI00352549FC